MLITYPRSSIPLVAFSATQGIISALFSRGQQGLLLVPEPTVDGVQVLFQDAAGTAPVVDDGDPVGLMLDLSPNGNHATQSVSADRPIYHTDGVRHWLRFNGVNHYLSGTIQNWGTKSFSLLSAVRPLSESTDTALFSAGSVAGTAGEVVRISSENGGGGYRFNNGNLLFESVFEGLAVPSLYTYGAPQNPTYGQHNPVRKNRSELSQTGSANTGLTSNIVDGEFYISAGRDSDAVIRYNANFDMHNLALVIPGLSQSTRDRAEVALAELSGITL